METNLFPLKYRLRKTNEPVEIVAWETSEKGARNENDWVSYIDSAGVEHIKEHLTLEWDFVIDSPFESLMSKWEPTKLPEYDPWEIVHALGEFDLDPCSSNANHKAPDFYTKEDDGLTQIWHGRVWCNPPYSQPALYQFCQKMAEHGNGILLIFARTGNKVWQEIIFPKATAVLFLRRRVRFCLPDGTQGGSAGCDSALVAFGWNNVEALEKAGIEGKLVVLK